jgi:hypothetical protein
MGQAHENEVWLLGLNMSIKPKWLQLLICAGGLFLGFLVNGVCEVRACIVFVLLVFNPPPPPPPKKTSACSLSLYLRFPYPPS